MDSQGNQQADVTSFAAFAGVLDRDRVQRLFAHRSLGDRAWMFIVWLAMAALLFGVVQLAGGGGRIPDALRWGVSVTFGIGMLVVGSVQQFASWQCRRWWRWNELLSGNYRTVVTESHVDIQTDEFALRVAYPLLAMADYGLSCVRIGLDLAACRAILLPQDDSTPARTTREIHQFIKQQLRDSKRNLVELPEVSNRDLPLPFRLACDSSAIRFQGPQRQGDVLPVIEANDPGAKQEAAKKPIYALIAFCFVVLLVLLTAGTLAGRQFDQGIWVQLISVGIVLFFVVLTAFFARQKRANIQADPNAEAGRLDGWISPQGFAIHYKYGYVAITWDSCDAVELAADQILAKFWRGDFMLIARHMFASNDEFEQAKQWASCFSDRLQTL